VETPAYSWVMFSVQDAAPLNIAQARMIQTPDGRHWALPAAAGVDADPHLCGAYLINPELLIRQPDTPEGIPVYLYRGVAGDSQ
jgi:hypothetical protein